MKPDAIIIFSGGIMPLPEGGWRPTTYAEADTFGTLGGQDRVEAGAALAQKYPGIPVVTTCKRMDGILPTLATTYAEALQKLGVNGKRVVKEENSINTSTSITEVVNLAVSKGWKNVLFVSSGFQIPRIQAFFEQIKSDLSVTFVPSESVLIENDPGFAESFAKIKETPAYRTRLAAEARGIEAIKSGKYRPAPIEEKKERPTS